jgi:hypothetical protein
VTRATNDSGGVVTQKVSLKKLRLIPEFNYDTIQYKENEIVNQMLIKKSEHSYARNFVRIEKMKEQLYYVRELKERFISLSNEVHKLENTLRDMSPWTSFDQTLHQLKSIALMVVAGNHIEMRDSLTSWSDVTWIQENQFMASNERLIEEILSQISYQEAYLLELTKEVSKIGTR